MSDFKIYDVQTRVDTTQSALKNGDNVGIQDEEGVDIGSFESFLAPVKKRDISDAFRTVKKEKVKIDSKKSEGDTSQNQSRVNADDRNSSGVSKNEDVSQKGNEEKTSFRNDETELEDTSLEDKSLVSTGDTKSSEVGLSSAELAAKDAFELSNRFFEIYGTTERAIDLQVEEENTILDADEIGVNPYEGTRKHDSTSNVSDKRAFGDDHKKFDDLATNSELDYTHLSDEEREVVDKFLQNQESLFGKERREIDAGDLLRRNNDSKIFFQVERGGTAMPYTGGSPSLTPLPFMQQTMANDVASLRHDGQISSMVGSDQAVEATTLSGKSDFDQGSSGKQNQMGFGANMQDKASSLGEQGKIINTQLSQSYAMPEFISQIKEQFQKFQSGNDKKVTVHMREGKKNLTLIMQMNTADGLDLTFRTTDAEWQNILEKNSQLIEEELALVNNGKNKINIRYLGD